MTPPHATPPQVVLIVEDDLDLLDTLKDVLVEAAHWRIVTAALPDLVVPVVEAAPPAVVVLDIGLPDMSGSRGARRPASAPALPHAAGADRQWHAWCPSPGGPAA